MPILFVHGVAIRDSVEFDAVEPYLRRIIAPAISSDPDGVRIDNVFWGDSAAAFAWRGASRPKTQLIGQGASPADIRAAQSVLVALARRDVISRLPVSGGADASSGSGLISGSSPARKSAPVRLSSFRDDELSDVLAAVIAAYEPDPRKASELSIAADRLARDRGVRASLETAAAAEDEVRVIFSRLADASHAVETLKGMGAGWLDGARDRLNETLTRGVDLPAYAASVIAAEVRPWLNEKVTVFMGDVLVYLDQRGDAQQPGPIMRKVLDALDAAQASKAARGGEPLVVITHSMGGQLMYDAISYFLPADPARKQIRIDFWCAAASQVALFEELKLFRLRDLSIKAPQKMPFPRNNLGVWWNVWDYNDFVSFTARDIFEGVDDESYSSGESLLEAHDACLRRPSFFRLMSERIERAKQVGWSTP